MAMVFEYFLGPDQTTRLDQRILANDIARFDAAEERKAIKVRVGITEAQRQEALDRQTTVMNNCLKVKVGLMTLRGTPMADPNTWSYTNTLFPNSARTQRKLDKLKSIEMRYWDFQRDRERISVTETDPNRRAQLIASIDTQLASLEAEKAERIADQSSPAAP